MDKLNYVTFPYGELHALTPEGKRRLDGDTLMGHIELTQERERRESAEKFLKSIADNTCCETCQEARLVAREHFKKYEDTGMIGSSPAQFMEKISDLEKKLEVLTKCSCNYQNQGASVDTRKCQGCKSKQLLEKDKK